MEKEKIKRRIFVLSLILILTILVYLFEAGIISTITRYIRREKDEIKAYYTSLYFNTDGNGKAIALENNVGYVDFNLMNFIGEDVTQRDIEYIVQRPSEFYDALGNEIASADLSSAEKLYVLDVWGEPTEVAKSTYLYDVEVVNNTGEIGSNINQYLFSYEKLGTSAVGKTHHLNLKLTRTSGELASEEPISIVIQLVKPYREVFVINMVVSTRLITFSNSQVDKFGVIFDRISIQTADLFAYSKNGEPRKSQGYSSNGTTYQDNFTSKAFKVTFTWTGFLLDEVELFKIHNGINEGMNGDEYFIDIKKPVFVSIDADSNHGTLVMFIPQSSKFDLSFVQVMSNAFVDVKIEIYVQNSVTGTLEYALYNSKYFGYTFDENDKYQLLNK